MTNTTGGADGSSSHSRGGHSDSPRRGGRGGRPLSVTPPRAAVTEGAAGSPVRKRGREVGESSAAAAGGGVAVAGNVPPPPPPPAGENVPVVAAAPPPPQPNHACSVCQRRFNSRQALFGHMRLHSNRGWRGAFPPPVFSREEFADVLPLLAAAEDGGDGAAANVEAPPPPPLPPALVPAAADAPPVVQPGAAAQNDFAVPDLNEPRYRVPDLNFPPPAP